MPFAREWHLFCIVRTSCCRHCKLPYHTPKEKFSRYSNFKRFLEFVGYEKVDKNFGPYSSHFLDNDRVCLRCVSWISHKTAASTGALVYYRNHNGGCWPSPQSAHPQLVTFDKNPRKFRYPHKWR
jgi:hypothetical protein